LAKHLIVTPRLACLSEFDHLLSGAVAIPTRGSCQIEDLLKRGLDLD
jgi:hypothetical protein